MDCIFQFIFQVIFANQYSVSAQIEGLPLTVTLCCIATNSDATGYVA